MSKGSWKFDTLAVQGGYTPESSQPRIMPIVQSTTFFYQDAEQVAGLFDLSEDGHMYSRISNPTVQVLEEKIACLEGGAGAVATSSGQAALALALFNICRSGQHVVASSSLYGGSFSLLSTTFKKLGIQVSFVQPDATVEEIKRAFRPETRALYGETLGNPGLNVLDIEKYAAVAQQMGVPLLVDNTFPTPYLCRPLEHGAHIVIHSTTKYLDGQATSVGGIIVDGGRFDWTSGRYPELTEPDPSYHGLRYTETFGPSAYIVKCRVQMLRDLGACMSPFNAFLTSLGVQTLPLRMARHSENALKLAAFLERDPRVTWVSYPGLSSSADRELAGKYLPRGASGILTFGLRGGPEAGQRFINTVKLAALVVHVGDIRTSVLHPASTTHRQLNPEQQIAAGVRPDMIRVSVGIEDIDDIIDDFDQAMAQAVSQ